MPKLKPEDSIFLFVRAADGSDILPPSFSAMAVIYEKHKVSVFVLPFSFVVEP